MAIRFRPHKGITRWSLQQRIDAARPLKKVRAGSFCTDAMFVYHTEKTAAIQGGTIVWVLMLE